MTTLKQRIHCVAVEIERLRDYFFYIPFILVGLDVSIYLRLETTFIRAIVYIQTLKIFLFHKILIDLRIGICKNYISIK